MHDHMAFLIFYLKSRALPRVQQLLTHPKVAGLLVSIEPTTIRPTPLRDEIGRDEFRGFIIRVCHIFGDDSLWVV